MVQFHEGDVILFVLSIALVYKIVYLVLIIDDGTSVKDIINIIVDIGILCSEMRFVWVSYHKSIIDRINASIEENKNDNKDRIEASDKENKERIAASEKENRERIAASKKDNEALIEAITKLVNDNKIQTDHHDNNINRVCNKMVSLWTGLGRG